MTNLSHIRSKADFIGTLNPKAWDAVHPHVPFVFSDAHVELMVADAVKTVAFLIADKNLSRKVLEFSRDMAQQSVTTLSSSWEPGDELCPPWPWPWPGPRPWMEAAGPHPEPWQSIRAAEQLELAHILTRLAGLTASKEFNAALKSFGTQLARVSVTTMVDEFEKCPTVPRKPFPPKR